MDTAWPSLMKLGPSLVSISRNSTAYLRCSPSWSRIFLLKMFVIHKHIFLL